MKFSDSFARKGEINLDLTVVQLNINPGYNEELKADCTTLYQYMQYVEKVRAYKETMPIEEAVGKSVDECIAEGILRDFLIKHKAEAIQMSIFEYDEELHKRTLIEEGIERGKEEGKVEGKLEGITEALLVLLEETSNIPIEIREKILAEKDMETLKRWVKQAANTESIQQFLKTM